MSNALIVMLLSLAVVACEVRKVDETLGQDDGTLNTGCTEGIEVSSLLANANNFVAWETHTANPVGVQTQVEAGPVPNSVVDTLQDNYNSFVAAAWQTVAATDLVDGWVYEFRILIKQLPDSGPGVRLAVRQIASGAASTYANLIFVDGQEPELRVDAVGPGEHSAIIAESCNGFYEVKSTIQYNGVLGGPIQVEVHPASLADNTVAQEGRIAAGGASLLAVQ